MESISGSPSSLTHVYDGLSAARTIYARAYDADGSYDMSPLTVSVGNVAPAATLGGASSVNEGCTFTLSLAASDPGDDPIDHWLVDWGDGPAQTIYGNPPALQHIYADDGAFAITAQPFDVDGGAGNVAGGSVSVANVEPTLSLSGPATLGLGGATRLRLLRTDPGDDAASVTVDWGDGASTTQAIDDEPLVLSHAYGDPTAGPFNVSATIADEDNTTGYAAVGRTVAHDANRLYRFLVGVANDYPLWPGTALVDGRPGIKAEYNTVMEQYGEASDLSIRAGTAEAALWEALETQRQEWNGNEWEWVTGPVFGTYDGGSFEATLPAAGADTGAFWADFNYHELHLNRTGTPLPDDTIWQFDVQALELAIFAVDTAVEGESPSPAPGFWITRSYAEAAALTVPLEVIHETTEASDFTLPTSVTIPAGETSAFVPLEVSDDEAPEWTESFTVAIGEGEWMVAGTGEARAEIVDSDLTVQLDASPRTLSDPGLDINIDDDDENRIYDCDETVGNPSDDELYMLHLDVPEARDGSVVTLSIGNPNVHVWMSAAKGLRLLGGPVLSATLPAGITEVFVELVEGTLGDDCDLTVFCADTPASQPASRPSTRSATQPAVADPEQNPATTVELIPRRAECWEPLKIGWKGWFACDWRLKNHRRGETGQIVQHVTWTQKTWAFNANPAADEPTRNVVLHDYWEAFTVTGNGMIKVKLVEGGAWQDGSLDTFRFGHPDLPGGGRFGIRGTIRADGLYRYVAGPPIVPELHRVPAAANCFSTREKPEGWSDDHVEKHWLEYTWMEPPANVNDPATAEMTVFPHMEVTYHP